MKDDIYNRELSWLSFNYRVLQEAKDKERPLLERLKFLAIYSSNLDEFFRVRVASLRSLLDLKKKKIKKIDFNPSVLLKKITTIVNKQQNEFGAIYRNEILPGLNENNIFIVKETELDKEQSIFVEEYFKRNLTEYVNAGLLSGKYNSLFLKNKALYLAVKLSDKTEIEKSKISYAVVEIPVEVFPRFIVLPKVGKKNFVMFLDDLVRKNLPLIFPEYIVEAAYSIKLTRDAELYIDDEFTGNLLDKIRKSLSNRSTGIPCRFLYEEGIPGDFLKYLMKVLGLNKKDLIPGARYHNFSDFFSFPNPDGKKLEAEPLIPLSSPAFKSGESLFKTIKHKDVVLHYPYHKFDYVIDFLNEAANDKDVKQIRITLYRTASESKIVGALCRAAKNGKAVTAFVEVKARFDEETNFRNADELLNAGVKVLFSFPGLKVHAKICLITRTENEVDELYAYLSTGNFNEKTAKIYSDLALFTYNKKITVELLKVFRFLSRQSESETFENLFVAPFNLRQSFKSLIYNEIENAAAGRPAFILLKMNSLENKKIIRLLYEASTAGVKIRIVVRGICGLIPGIKGLSENITVTSIVDRFLEHSRIFIFHNNGDEKIYLSSADWMTRNLKRRVELCFPVYDESVRQFLKEVMKLQLNDNIKARVINKIQSNPFVKPGKKSGIRVQYDTINLIQKYRHEDKVKAPADV